MTIDLRGGERLKRVLLNTCPLTRWSPAGNNHIAPLILPFSREIPTSSTFNLPIPSPLPWQIHNAKPAANQLPRLKTNVLSATSPLAERMSPVDIPAHVQLERAALYHQQPNGEESFVLVIIVRGQSFLVTRAYRVGDVRPKVLSVFTARYVMMFHTGLLSMGGRRMRGTVYLSYYRLVIPAILHWMLLLLLNPRGLRRSRLGGIRINGMQRLLIRSFCF